MGVRLKVPFLAHIGSGGVLTFVGTAEDQAVYWSVQAFDPETGLFWGPVGSLRKEVTFTDKSSRATNIYMAPDHRLLKRYGMGYKFGEIKFGEESELYDRVTAKAVLE